MVEVATRQARLVGELAEWWEDLWQTPTGSRVVLVVAPRGWGRSTALDRFVTGISARDDAPVTFTIQIEGQALQAIEAPGSRAQALARALQVQVLRANLDEATEQHRAVHWLGLDEPTGQAQLGLGVASLVFSGLTAGISFLLAGLAVGAVGKAWDDSPAGQDGALARTARAVAAVSVGAPVTVIIDDADHLDIELAVTMIENLTARQRSQVLVIAVMEPGSVLPNAIRSQLRHGLTVSLVHDAELDPDMGYESRLELARQLRPNLPDAGTRRMAQRTTTFAEVFTVAAAPRLAEIGSGEDVNTVRSTVDAAASGRLTRPAPSPEAAVIAWAGGLVHPRQADRALSILGATRTVDDPDVRRGESLERLADPTNPRLADQVANGLTDWQRQDMAAAFLEEAFLLSQDLEVTLVDRAAALRAAHTVRDDLPTPGLLPRAQRELAAALEAFGDYAAALDVAATALEEWSPGAVDDEDRAVLAATVIRLSHITPYAPSSPLAQQLIAEAAERGALALPEALVWAAVTLLATPGQREAALDLAHHASLSLEARSDLGSAGNLWRLLLAYRADRAGLPDLTNRLLTPLITSADAHMRKIAIMVRHAVDGPGADTRLQNVILEAELAALPPNADDDQLRLRHALAANYDTLGDYRQALAHSRYELDLRTHIQGPRHPATLITQAGIAYWTGNSGDPAAALELYQELLPIQEQVFGPYHHQTLAIRGNIAVWTGFSGDANGALRLYRELLPVRERVLGRRDPDTLLNRANIAYWTGESGDAAAALHLYRELLPDQQQVLGPRHHRTLSTRANVARWVGESGDAAAALHLYQELLPDQVQVLGQRHPDALITRGGIARWAHALGNPAVALHLLQELLPDAEQVLGRRHPDVLNIRANIAKSTEDCGKTADAMRLYQELLPDQEQILGSRHPATLATRRVIASLADDGQRSGCD